MRKKNLNVRKNNYPKNQDKKMTVTTNQFFSIFRNSEYIDSIIGL